MNQLAEIQTAEEANEDALMRGMTPNELRMLNLLGAGVPQEIVAATCGVTPAYVSQLMDMEGFKSLVAKLRYEKLQAQSNIDSEYDSMESQIQDKMKKVIPMLTKPRDILDFASRLNAMKRRGQGQAASSDSNASVVINLQLPTAILNKIVVDPTTNRVIEANGQEMITLPSNNMAETLNEHRQKAGSEESGASAKISFSRRPIGANDL